MEESEIEPNLENPELSRTTNTSSEETDSLMNSSITEEEEMITRVDLHLHVGPNTIGDLWVILASVEGRLLAHKFVREGDYYTGWNSVTFEEPVPNTEPLGKYRIYVKRQRGHDYPSGNYIFWNSSPRTDVYPGDSGYFPNGTDNPPAISDGDFAFKVYKDSSLNQQQLLNVYGYALGTGYRFQEIFVR